MTRIDLMEDGPVDRRTDPVTSKVDRLPADVVPVDVMVAAMVIPEMSKVHTHLADAVPAVVMVVPVDVMVVPAVVMAVPVTVRVVVMPVMVALVALVGDLAEVLAVPVDQWV